MAQIIYSAIAVLVLTGAVLGIKTVADRHTNHPIVTHIGATAAYANALHDTGEMRVCSELATLTEQWLWDHTDLNHIEDELHAGLDAAYARLLVGLGLEPDDVDYADAVGLGLTTWDAAREAAGIHTLPPAPQRLALTAGPCADVPELVPA